MHKVDDCRNGGEICKVAHGLRGSIVLGERESSSLATIK